MATKRSLKKIPLGTSSLNSHIDSRKRYRVRIDGKWYEGGFSKAWFGWSFDGYRGTGMQLNLIEEVYEIVPPGARKPGPPRR
jgi:hypothetical protein